MTVQELVSRSLRTIGVLGAGQTAGGSEAADALTILNALLDSWQASRLTIYRTARETYSLVASTADYTIGDGGTFDRASVPVWIDQAAYVLPGSDPAYEQRIAVYTPQQWQRIPDKSRTQDLPAGVYLDRQAPTGTLSVYPVPTQALTLVLYVPTPLAGGLALTDTLSLPPGYEDALVYNLALRLAPEWTVEPSNWVQALAASSYSLITRPNVQPSELTLDPALTSPGGRWNYHTGDFYPCL